MTFYTVARAADKEVTSTRSLCLLFPITRTSCFHKIELKAEKDT